MSRSALNNVILLPVVTRNGPSSAPPRLPSPVDVFADWFKSLPPEVDLEAAAAIVVARIDQRSPSHPDAAMLRALFAAFAGNRHLSTPTSNR